MITTFLTARLTAAADIQGHAGLLVGTTELDLVIPQCAVHSIKIYSC